MRIAIVTTSYPAFLAQLYAATPGLAQQSYAEQLAARNASLFGFADFYSRGFCAHGHEAIELHINNPWLQAAWAREQGVAVPPIPVTAEAQEQNSSALRRALSPLRPVLKPVLRRFHPPRLPPWQAAVLRAQVAAFQPDIIYNQEPVALQGADLEALRHPGRRLIGQIASGPPPADVFRPYDLMVSSLPNFVRRFRGRGIPALYNRLAFEPSVRAAIGSLARDIPVSFVGNFSRVHRRRVALLEHLAGRVPLMLWGTGIERLAPQSPLHRLYQGPAFGRAMLEILARSQITLNNHEAVAGIYANNLRLYEGTGMGCLLVTDRQADLPDIFAPDTEVAAYDTPHDCLRRIEHHLGDPTLCAQVAAAGQARTDRDHSYFRRTGELLEAFTAALAGQARARFL